MKICPDLPVAGAYLSNEARSVKKAISYQLDCACNVPIVRASFFDNNEFSK